MPNELMASEVTVHTGSTCIPQLHECAWRVWCREAFEKISLGGLAGDKRTLANPLAMYSTQLIGNDSNGARMAPAPTFGSRNTAIDMVERYWMALCRYFQLVLYLRVCLGISPCTSYSGVKRDSPPYFSINQS